jgi:benzoylformate decarboxylase
VYAAQYTEVNFPTSHPLFGGFLNLNSAATRQQLAGADVLLAVGANVFASFLYVAEPFLSPGTKLIHLDSKAREVEKVYPTEVGLVADPRSGLEDLAQALDQDMSASAREAAATRAATWGETRQREDQERRQRLRSRWDRRPMAVERMMYELGQALPANAIIADEAVTSRPAMMQAISFDQPGSFYGIQGGALGWAMPGALGVKLANPDRPVVAVVGDGASMYTVQALWTAARFNIPVVYAICNNRSYRILKQNMDIYLRRMLNDQERQSEYVGMDFANHLDLAAMAQAMGVAGQRVEDPGQLRSAVERAIASGKPALLDVSIDGSL